MYLWRYEYVYINLCIVVGVGVVLLRNTLFFAIYVCECIYLCINIYTHVCMFVKKWNTLFIAVYYTKKILEVVGV